MDEMMNEKAELSKLVTNLTSKLIVFNKENS